MSVSLEYRGKFQEIGSSSFLHSFFSTISKNLEPMGWGSRFPTLMLKFYEGELPHKFAEDADIELNIIAREFSHLSPSLVVWDIDNLEKNPPWDDEISEDITDLSNYFVTSDGKNLILELLHFINMLKLYGGSLRII